MKEATKSNICPHCHNPGTIYHVEAGLRLLLQQTGAVSPVPTEACGNCIQQFTKAASSGAILRAEEEAKAQARYMLWRNRVSLVRQAKTLMQSKLYSDAAVAYEKYLRILEVIYEKESGQLFPHLFTTEARRGEITVIAGVYWDLLRIYDTHERYMDRQVKAAEKLADFAPATPVFDNLIRKAENQIGAARNPNAYRHFIKLANAKRERCFIATAAFDYQRTYEVETLCAFRDEVLTKYSAGRVFIKTYYQISPPIARFLNANPKLKPVTRKFLNRCARTISLIHGASEISKSTRI